MRRYSKLFIAGILLVSCFNTGCTGATSSTSSGKKSTVGVVMGAFKDTWRTSVRNQLYKMAGDTAEVDIYNGNNSQENENEKVDLLISRKVNVLVVNLVEASAASSIIDKAKNADIPVIFFNVQPSTDDMKKWDKVYYVGAKGEQSGTMQGQILANYFKNHPATDGVINYVLIKGPEGHQDAVSRSKFSVKALEDAGLKVEKLEEDTANWDRTTAAKKIGGFLNSQGDKIDCVIANNDDMALGAIDALKGKGYFKDGKYMPVVGVDATSSAINAIKDGTLLGTVLNDAENQGKAIFGLSQILIKGQTPDKAKFSYAIEDSKYIWVDYMKITKDNVKDVK